MSILHAKLSAPLLVVHCMRHAGANIPRTLGARSLSCGDNMKAHQLLIRSLAIALGTIAVAAPSYAHWGPWSAAATPGGPERTCTHSSPTRKATVRIVNTGFCGEFYCDSWREARFKNTSDTLASIFGWVWSNDPNDFYGRAFPQWFNVPKNVTATPVVDDRPWRPFQMTSAYCSVSE